MKHLKCSSINCNQVVIIQKQLHHFEISRDAYASYYLALDKGFNLKEFVELEVQFASPNLPRGLRYTYVVDSCNGLVCLREFDYCFFLWNPATNQCRNVSPPDLGDNNLRICRSWFGFAYVSSTDDYIIVCLMTFEEKVCHYMFSLRAGKWIKVDSLDENNFYKLYYSHGYAVDDTMYWPPENFDKKGSDMIALNLVSGQLRKIPLMNFGINYSYFRVSQIKGCLSLYCMSVTNTSPHLLVTDVWMLKQRDNWDSWEKMFTLRDTFSSLLHIFDTGECLVKQGANQLMLHSPSHAALKEYEEGSVMWHTSEQDPLFHSLHARGYVESLISPFGTPWYEDDNETPE
ncbi:F-box protein CPR1 [Bienertia sinuspersici]